jgi:cytochrome c-type biogenesis protein CcmH/NrfG
MKALLLAILVIAVVGGGSFAYVRSRIASDIEQGRPIAETRAAERDRRSASAEREKTLTGLLRTLEDSLQTRPSDSMLVLSAANISYDLGKFDIAVRYYRRFLDSVDPGNKSVRIDYAYALYQTGRQDEGMEELAAVIRRDPSNQAALLNLAVMHAQAQRFEEALTWFRRCRDADSTSDLGKRAAMAVEQLQQ